MDSIIISNTSRSNNIQNVITYILLYFHLEKIRFNYSDLEKILKVAQFTETPTEYIYEIYLKKYSKIIARNLKEINLTSSNISELSNFPNLEKLTVRNLELKEFDIQLPKLKYLDISGNKLRSLEGFSNNFPNLEYLDISYNKITNLNPLRLIKLKTLLTNGNDVRAEYEDLPRSLKYYVDSYGKEYKGHKLQLFLNNLLRRRNEIKMQNITLYYSPKFLRRPKNEI